ncbi:hypothetical protein [Sandarakinorhabdus sp.]|uniref:ATP-grasp domain-containing protein n=1 Tax=Sandarakinorhabdus sp. TaxID=1916663 RepID=UPI003340C5AB
MRLILIAAPGKRETDRMIEAACAARGLPCVKIVPGAAGGLDLGPPSERRLFYCTGVSLACITIEQMLFRAGDSALHDPFFHYANQPLIFQRAGLPRPATVYVPDPDAAALARQVAGLGGWPVVMKLPGTEGGQGVSLVHDLESLQAALAVVRSSVTLEAYFAHVRCWRVTVLNGAVLAATARVAGAGDFRSNGPGSGPVDCDTPPPGLAEIAIRAAQVLKLEFGGADIMEAADGSLRIAEFNSPCYFAEQQELTGIDIAGAIVDRLIEMGPHPTAARW